MNPIKLFLRAHLLSERQVLLLPPAPPRVEMLFAAQETINSMIDTWTRAIAFLEQLEPISDYVLDAMKARIICFVELSEWGIPDFANQWFTGKLPDTFALRLAEMIQHNNTN